MRIARHLLSITLAGIVSAAALLTLPGFAQTTEAEQDTATEPEAQETAATQPAPAPEPEASEDPFDYEASEQISEDLSVSFPVDI